MLIASRLVAKPILREGPGIWASPLAVFEVGVNYGDAIMMLGVLLYGSYTVALRFRPDIHWTSLMFVLTCLAAIIAYAEPSVPA